MALFTKLAETWRFLRYGPTRLNEAVRNLDQQSREMRQWIESLDARLTQLHQHVAALDQTLATTREQAGRDGAWARNHIGAMTAALDRLQPASGAGSAAAALPASAAAAEESFYPTLEQYFRGSAEDLRNRLGVYRNWMAGLPPGPVADLGCGRGEWLELLGEWGVPARGVDLNALNVQGMRERGLDAEQGDLLQWLQAQPEDSFAALTSFHVVEHLPFGILLRLVQEARRVLKPGGRLILETPNPENVIVATQTFWLDPSHVRPLPPALLELVVRDAGLEVEALLRLNPPAEDAHDVTDATLRALMTQGRDCAVVARKPTVAAA